MNKIKPGSIFFMLLTIVILLSFSFINNPGERDFLLKKNMDIFFSVIREINLFYVDDKDPDKLIENGINGVLEGLDPYTTYVPASEKDNYATLTTGRYGGIGALIRQIGDYVMIIEPYENFPAQQYDLRAGDIITAIDGNSTKGMLVNEVSELLKGSPNSSLKITIRRHGYEDPITKEIIRTEVKIDNVAWYGLVDNKVGYIQFNGFTENAHMEVREAFNKLRKNHDITSIILDVRGNPGGLLMEAVNVTNLFVEKGREIVSTRGKLKQWDHTYKARNKPADPDIPVVVLVGRSSASAAEIVAGAIQDLDRGVIIGQRTFGKGLIQTTRQLSYDAQLKITTAKYYTPSGRCIQSLNFSDEGSVNFIHDSLKTEFRTLNGRPVYDGGGIMPDIYILEESPGSLLLNLYAGNYIFNYATIYASQNPEIGPVNSFKISDQEYGKFIEYLEESDFSYRTQTEIKLDELINAARQENYDITSGEILEKLEMKIAQSKLNDLEKYKRSIKSLLKEEIVSRYYFQKGRIEASLEDDLYIEKAIQILNNNSLYNSIIEGTVMDYKANNWSYPGGKTVFELQGLDFFQGFSITNC